MTASDRQVDFAIDLLMHHGVYPNEAVTPQMSRRYKLPQGDTVRNAVKSLTMIECSALIKECLDAN